MKSSKLLSILLAVYCFLAYSAMADEYKGPAIKLKNHKMNDVSVSEGSLQNDLSYKVQESAVRDRNLASDENKDATPAKTTRDPSSKSNNDQKSDKTMDTPGENQTLPSWKFDKNIIQEGHEKY